MLKLSAQEQLLPGDTLQQKWDFAQRAGYDAIELRGRADFALRERLPELRQAQRDGVVMPTVCVEMLHFFGAFDPDLRADAIAQMKSQLSVIAELGGLGAMSPASYGMFSRRLPPFEPPRSEAEDRQVLLDGLRQLGEHAAAEGVTFYLEPLNRYEDHMVNRLDQAIDLIREVGLDSVKVGADTYHMNIEEDDPCAALRAAGDLLGAVHVSDSNRHQPGTGHVPFDAIVATLREIGFDGVLSVECRLRGEPEQAVRDCGRFLRAFVG
jgi:sugar phosphate isomerase/epimerase